MGAFNPAKAWRLQGLPASPASRYEPVTANDSTDLPGGICRGLLVTAAGTANLDQPDGTARTAVPLVAGFNPIAVKRVRTGGTATGLFALY